MRSQWLHEVRQRGLDRRPCDLAELAELLMRSGPAAAWRAEARFDPSEPYGRTVLLVEGDVELMVAGWTRDRPCAPHDHGPGLGVVRVIQGRARHRGYLIVDGALVPDTDERLGVDALVHCPVGRVHQMQDDGAEEPLVTLHLYLGPTAPMVVYDAQARRTQWLRAGCGAWPHPVDDQGVQRWADGFWPSHGAGS